MVKTRALKRSTIILPGALFCLGLSIGSIISPATSSAFNTPNEGVIWTMDDLAGHTQGAVGFRYGSYVFTDNVIITEKDTLSISSTDLIVFDCSTKVVRLIVEGNLDSASGCSTIIADKPIHSPVDLDNYQKYPGIIYDDIGIRRRAIPKIKSIAVSLSSFTNSSTAVLHGIITDASTGKQIPARISILNANGVYVSDTDRTGHLVEYYAYPGLWTADGIYSCTLPPGTTDITISQGKDMNIFLIMQP